MIKNKKGQMMELPFQLIFSIILIAVFLYAAVYGIRYFMERSEQVQAVQFISDLKEKVNIAWQSTEMSREYSFDLPKRIKKVCFSSDLSSSSFDAAKCPEFENYRDAAANLGKNLFFCPPEEAYKLGIQINYKIDCDGKECLEFSKNPTCVDNVDGKVTIRLEKAFGKPDVKLS